MRVRSTLKRPPARRLEMAKRNKRVQHIDADAAYSERNEAFYKQDGFYFRYPKSLVYPVGGGEVQLEQLRARLDKYCPPPQNESGDDMEMTMACTTNITLLPGLNKENMSVLGRHTNKPPSSTRHPLQLVSELSPDEKLARLAQENQELSGVERGKAYRDDSGEVISELLDHMMLQQSAEREIEKQQCNKPQVKPVPLCNGQGGRIKDDRVSELASLRNQENQPGVNDLASLKNQPQTNTNLPQNGRLRSNRGLATRLNFSDSESSFGASAVNSLLEDSVGGRVSVLGHSQVQVREQEQSGLGGQSFEVFHDSWRNQSHNASHGRPYTAPDNLPTTRQFGKPLKRSFQEPVQQSIPPEPCNQSVSFQAGVSKSNMSSFSVYDDSLAEQSSFVPFHDSWVNMSKDAATHRRTSETIADKLSTCSNAGATGPRAPSSWPGEAKVYQATLGVPLEGDGVGGGGCEVSVVEQSFTQIGIRHPKIAPSISTPVGKNMKDLTCNISRIQTETEYNMASATAATGVVLQRRRSCILDVMNLSTIKEESSSLKSSRSSACTTGSTTTNSSSSSNHDSPTGRSHTSSPEVEINPFSSEIVNKMLNAMSPSIMSSVCSVPKALPQLSNGRTVLLGDREYSALKTLTSGGFGTIYSCKDKGETKVLKVQKPPLQWEIAIIAELHVRLKLSGLLTECFIKTEQSFLFKDASVMVLPYYSQGSLLDLANTDGAHLYKFSLFYYVAEVLEIVASLHHCGILHTDIKPDNFLLNDLSSYKSFGSAYGRGLVLIDFGRAVDLTAFPGDTVFQGSCETEGFQCTQMLEGKPWKYEADYFGIAATAYVLLTGQYMSVVKDPKTNLYQPQKPLHRSHASVWSNLLSCLMNTTQPLPLIDIATDMRTRLDNLAQYIFQGFLRTTVAKK